MSFHVGAGLRTIMITLVLVSALPAAADDRVAANRLFVGAVTAWNAAQAEPGQDATSLTRRVQLLEQVVTRENQIVRDHAGADLAVRLVSGERIGPLSLTVAADEAAKTRNELIQARADICYRAPTRTCPFASALATARGIDDRSDNAWALAEIAVSLAKAGLVAEALDTARGINDRLNRAWALAEIAVAHPKTETIAEALDTARGINEKVDRARALGWIAVAPAKAELFADALSTARALQPNQRSFALADIAVSQAKAGFVAQALNTARGIESQQERAIVLAEIAVSHPRAEIIAEALAITRGISEGFSRARALAMIAAALPAR